MFDDKVPPENIPAPHQRLIAQLIERGFIASFRQWAMGDTVLVCDGEFWHRGIRAFKRGAYLIPTEDGLWQVDIGIYDDAPVPEDAVVERVTPLLCDQDAYEREFDRRRRLLEAQRATRPRS